MKTKDLRSKLFNAITMIEEGKLEAQDARGIIGMANQINISIQTEIKNAELNLKLGKKVVAIGNMDIN